MLVPDFIFTAGVEVPSIMCNLAVGATLIAPVPIPTFPSEFTVRRTASEVENVNGTA